MAANSAPIGVAALVTAATITAAELEDHDALPTTQQWIGFSLAFFLMAAAADLGLPIASGLAVLLMVSTVITRGESALAYATGKTRARIRPERKP